MADSAAVAIDTAALLAQTRSRAQSDERRRLARDLHDSVVQQVFSMRMQAEALRTHLDQAGADPAVVRSGAEELAALSASALADLRGLVFELRPLDLAENGLVKAVCAHTAGVEARTGLLVDVEAPDDLDLDVDVEVQEDLYRIVQEALHNVVKHAAARQVSVIVERRGDELTALVEDDGRGFDPEGVGSRSGRRGLGLLGMRERVGLVGGTLLVESGEGEGTTVRARIPLHRPPGEACHDGEAAGPAGRRP
jgi:signal transduction histidine kinase